MTLPVKKIATNIATKTKNKANENKTARNVIIGLIAVPILFFSGRAVVRKIRKDKAERNAPNNPNIQQAMLLHSAMNPSGVNWLMWSDGTIEKAIYRVAKQITDFNKVAIQYKNLYSSSLITDLQKELTQNEFTKFMNIINSKNGNAKNNTNAIEYSDKLKMIYTTRDTKFYDSTTYLGLPFAGQSIGVNTIPLALTTGREFKLALFGYGSVVTAIELKTRTKEKGEHLIYIDKNDVRIFPREKLKEYKLTKKIRQFREADF